MDEIFLAAPASDVLVKRLVEQAREAGVDIRVVPDLYDGLAWNSPVEYIGQFPTIPLHRGELPVLGMVMKRLLDIAVSSVALVLFVAGAAGNRHCGAHGFTRADLLCGGADGEKGTGLPLLQVPHHGARCGAPQGRDAAYE